MATVRSVHISPVHEFSKSTVSSIALITGQGVEGDAHCGEYVKHRSRVAVDPTQPNLRQVHLMMGESLDSFHIPDGEMGENITTIGIDLHALPTSAILTIGSTSLQITGLRNPCAQINNYRDGLLGDFRQVDDEGNIVRTAGVMAVVISGGVITTGDEIFVALPTGEPQPLQPV
jgi:MOSC domain-containing protein YiiM